MMEMDLSSMWLFSKKQQFLFMYKPEHCLPGAWPCQAPGGGPGEINVSSQGEALGEGGSRDHSWSTQALSWPDGAAGLVLPKLLGHVGAWKTAKGM